MLEEHYWNPMVPEITVMNFEKSLSFYTQILGFSVRYSREEPKFAYLYQGAVQLMIEAVHEDGWDTGSLQHPLGRGVNFQMELETIEPLYQRVIASATPLYRDIKESWYQTNRGLQGQREFLLQDPDGYLLRFCQDLGDKPVV